jgi:CheY-like chemotaxis protein
LPWNKRQTRGFGTLAGPIGFQPCHSVESVADFPPIPLQNKLCGEKVVANERGQYNSDERAGHCGQQKFLPELGILQEKPRILVIGGTVGAAEQFLATAGGFCEVVREGDPTTAIEMLSKERFQGVYLGSEHLQEALEIGRLLRNEQILQEMPAGVVLLDSESAILWSNGRLEQWTGQGRVAGCKFYQVLGNPEILGPDFCPFHTALATGTATGTTLRLEENRYYQVHVAPVEKETARHLIVTLRDVTVEVQQQQKLAAIHQAGMQLADLTAEELLDMSIDERIELLKSNILHFTQDLLKYEVVEIRLLDPKTSRLEPLVAVGMDPAAADRVLYAKPQDNGVTGFVAATGKSYLCEDTTEDPLYLPGARGAKSSLTVPLLLHDEVIGTFNVESDEPRAFTENDLQFLEIFTRDVAAALNTLELLVAEKASTAAASVEAIHSAVALPVDEILNDAVNVMERYIGHEPDVVDRLQRILRNARDIKQTIQKVGQTMAPATAHPAPPQPEREALLGCQILLVDEDASVRSAAHALLERYGCIVEAAPNGVQAMSMVRAMRDHGGYAAIIADIRLPDMSGYEFLVKLQDIVDVEPLPLILMTGFGYDPGHSIVKARQAGVSDVLYKPFRLDQLLATVEKVVTTPRAVGQASG